MGDLTSNNTLDHYRKHRWAEALYPANIGRPSTRNCSMLFHFYQEKVRRQEKFQIRRPPRPTRPFLKSRTLSHEHTIKLVKYWHLFLPHREVEMFWSLSDIEECIFNLQIYILCMIPSMFDANCWLLNSMQWCLEVSYVFMFCMWQARNIEHLFVVKILFHSCLSSIKFS